LGARAGFLPVQEGMKSLIAAQASQTVFEALWQERGTNVYHVWITYTTFHLYLSRFKQYHKKTPTHGIVEGRTKLKGNCKNYLE